MAKTLMISNEVYDSLKEVKGSRSFSEVIMDLMLNKKNNAETLAKYYGAIKGDIEYTKIKKDTDKKWKEWTKKYA